MSQFIPITDQIIRKIKTYRDHTGLSPAKLIERYTEIPKALTEKTVDNWLSGQAKSGQKAHVAFMLSAYEEIARDHISTALYVDELRAHKRRTGINARHLLKQAKDIPEGLTAREIDRWIKPRPTAARRDHLDFVLDLWRRQPDRTDDLIPVTPEMVAEIKAHRRRTGVSFYAIIYNGTEPPEGLHPATLYQVVGGTQRSIRKKHYEYMIAAYENYRRPDIRHSAETIAPLRAEQERTGLSISRLVRLQNKTPEGFSATRMQRFFNGYQKTVPKEHYNYLLSCYAAQPEKNK